jgi:hypothetical protein
MSETALRSGPFRGTAFSAWIGGIVKRRLVAAMRDQISIFISIEACEADVFQYCVMRSQQTFAAPSTTRSVELTKLPFKAMFARSASGSDLTLNTVEPNSRNKLGKPDIYRTHLVAKRERQALL